LNRGYGGISGKHINDKNIFMKQFEYKTIEFEPSGKWLKVIRMESSELEDKLNDMGKEGRELIDSVDYSVEGYTIKVILFLKREK
jgi:hypothetical protein